MEDKERRRERGLGKERVMENNLTKRRGREGEGENKKRRRRRGGKKERSVSLE